MPTPLCATLVIYNVEKAIRAEDNLANLVIHNTTFGEQINTMLEFAGKRKRRPGTGSWDWRNNAFACSGFRLFLLRNQPG